MFRPLLLATALGLMAQTATAEVNPGAYLAGRQAQTTNDYREASRYLAQALAGDPNDYAILEQLAASHISLGEIDEAAAIASRLTQAGGTSQLANLATLAQQTREGEWSRTLEDMEAGLSVGSLFDGLARAWTLLGDGQTDAALAAFDAVAGQQGLAAFGRYHKALALASLERFEDAEALLADGALSLTRRGTVAHAQILSQLGRPDEAIATIEEAFGNGTLDEPLSALRDRLQAGETIDYTIARDAVEGMAETAFDIGNILVSEASPAFTLLYGRTVTYLRPDHVEAILLNSALLDELGQYELAIEASEGIPEDDPAFAAAEIGRAEIMIRSDRLDEAIDTLRALSESHPSRAPILMALADALREDDRTEEANAVYTDALEAFGDDDPSRWIALFSRAVTYERLDEWSEAEADFRAALEVNPDSPIVLNYLGYSMLERGEDYDEALSLIERAVAARPDSGFIVDSLGWGLYRLGRFDEAVEPMERAVELMPVDPVVNDHLGDVYWMVGRKLEARFQWQRALSFVDNDQNDEVEPDRIRRKLEIGLDRVIDEEEGTPLIVNDGG
ncbi:tetratricopeptide repeat protein [Palleronia sp. LCG004]|uniref:tetratricopeptide repeat protein n=1 Tax=Palleronia sp. LCG004 TaxID=3079304 RepID=UPI0029428BD7|nr:tetratricopeptide repeat protein [Palleronia sp. LCG004]WOI56375.1 tetratricopeptide repeat protein [Palleronia sp. LCG004]